MRLKIHSCKQAAAPGVRVPGLLPSSFLIQKLMEKMYTKRDILKVVVAERNRVVGEIHNEIALLERAGREKPALKGRFARAIASMEHLLLLTVNMKPKQGIEFEDLLYAACEKDYFGGEPAVNKVTLDAAVFPSDEKTIQVVYDEVYGGAHCYILRESLGFNKGKAEYIDDAQVIRFVQKLDDGTIIPGLQSEQLVIALLDRTRKLNDRFPSAQNEKMMTGLQMFLDACRERVEDRMNRGVMGDLKK